MRNNKKYSIRKSIAILFIMGLIGSYPNHLLAQDKSMVGIYNITIDPAPYKYETGTLELKLDANEEWDLTVRINHEVRKGRYVEVVGDSLEFLVYLIGYRVKFKMGYKDGKFEGASLIPNQDMKIVGIRRE